MALGEEGAKAHHLRLGQPKQVAHDVVSLRSLNHANSLKSMGLEPSALATLAPAHAASLINGSFEEPRFTPGVADVSYPLAGAVPGWSTTATDSVIEVWSDGFLGVAAYDGAQFVELNANQVSTLFQDVAGIETGGILSFGFAHRGRLGTDTMALSIYDLGIDNVFGTADDSTLFTKQYSDGNTAWGYYTSDGEAEIVSTGNTLRFAYESISAAGGNQGNGNFIDIVSFGLEVPPSAVPVPAALPLLVAGLGALGVAGRRKRRTN